MYDVFYTQIMNSKELIKHFLMRRRAIFLYSILGSESREEKKLKSEYTLSPNRNSPGPPNPTSPP